MTTRQQQNSIQGLGQRQVMVPERGGIRASSIQTICTIVCGFCLLAYYAAEPEHTSKTQERLWIAALILGGIAVLTSMLTVIRLAVTEQAGWDVCILCYCSVMAGYGVLLTFGFMPVAADKVGLITLPIIVGFFISFIILAVPAINSRKNHVNWHH